MGATTSTYSSRRSLSTAGRSGEVVHPPADLLPTWQNTGRIKPDTDLFNVTMHVDIMPPTFLGAFFEATTKSGLEILRCYVDRANFRIRPHVLRRCMISIDSTNLWFSLWHLIVLGDLATRGLRSRS